MTTKEIRKLSDEALELTVDSYQSFLELLHRRADDFEKQIDIATKNLDRLSDELLRRKELERQRQKASNPRGHEINRTGTNVH